MIAKKEHKLQLDGGALSFSSHNQKRHVTIQCSGCI